jgi:hypothetical protein
VRREALSLGALVAVLAGRGGAQVVRGTVSAAGVRVPGAIVLLVDAEGRTVARAAARDDGTYSVAAPATGERGGRYTLRVLRIGFTPTVVGPIALPRGAVTTRDVSLTGAPVRLAEVRVSDRARCRARPESDTTALRLLEEARKALLGETLTRAEPLRMRITTAERELDAAGGRTVSEKADTRLVSGVRPFATNVPPESRAT